jgi:uncharacterized membrane protein
MSALHHLHRRRNGRRKMPFTVIFACACIFLLPAVLTANTRSQPSTLTTRIVNLEATATETFRFSASLHNGSTRAVIYAFRAEAPAGWNTVYRVDGMQVTSFRIDSARTQDISIELTPGPGAKPGKYQVPFTATAEGQTLSLQLEAVVKGNYALELTTPTGRLSDEITEGSSKTITLTVRNTGSLPLDGVELSAQSPTRWETLFEPAKIDRLEAGKTVDVTARIKVPDKTIAGDYLTTINARHNNANATAAFRMTVTTSWLAGWLGVLILLAAVGVVYSLIRKYGRR